MPVDMPTSVLSALESQMSAYLRAFKLPTDYQERMLALGQLMESNNQGEAERTAIKARLERIKDLYAWGDMSKAQYLAERHELQARQIALAPKGIRGNYLDRLRTFL